MWNFRTPCRMNYESEEAYLEALNAFEEAESIHEDECLERYYEEKYNN